MHVAVKEEARVLAVQPIGGILSTPVIIQVGRPAKERVRIRIQAAKPHRQFARIIGRKVRIQRCEARGRVATCLLGMSRRKDRGANRARDRGRSRAADALRPGPWT
ncbi:MAG: hypothetical protein HBSAPP02_11320 [Phycisphaerae bacterium]|nr:MAG: hypothetical protein HBSAPP02_11320 [Phycisphaerae bacterium]